MLFQELGKLKRSSIMMSIIMMAVGLLMIVWPQRHVDALVSALGYGMLVLATVMVLDFIAGKRVLINYISLTAALIIALLGVVVLILDNIVLAIGLVFGLWLILERIPPIQRLLKKIPKPVTWFFQHFIQHLPLILSTVSSTFILNTSSLRSEHSLLTFSLVSWLRHLSLRLTAKAV